MKKIEYEDHRNKFLQARNILQSQHNGVALAKAYHKPLKWYGKYTVEEAVKILQTEASNKTE